MAHIAHCLLDILRYKAHEPLILSESDEVIHGTYVSLRCRRSCPILPPPSLFSPPLSSLPPCFSSLAHQYPNPNSLTLTL